MQLMRVSNPGPERPVVAAADEQFLDLSALCEDIDAASFAKDGLRAARRAIDWNDLPAVDIAGQRTGAPASCQSLCPAEDDTVEMVIERLGGQRSHVGGATR